MRLPQHAQDLSAQLAPQRRWILAGAAVVTLLFLGYFMFSNESVAVMSVFHIGTYSTASTVSCACCVLILALARFPYSQHLSRLSSTAGRYLDLLSDHLSSQARRRDTGRIEGVGDPGVMHTPMNPPLTPQSPSSSRAPPTCRNSRPASYSSRPPASSTGGRTSAP